MKRTLFAALLLVVAFSGFALLGCTDTETVYVDKPLFDDPPEAAAGFLGYDEADKKLTVCGNCHAGIQAEWEPSAHAHAWDTIADRANPAPCQDCHSVGQLGSATSTPGGYATTLDTRYRDVQCESCHGPGLEHVTNPDATQPLASVVLGDISPPDYSKAMNCAECHQGNHHPFVDEWALSPHAHVVESAASNPSCQGCHRGQQVIERFGDHGNYIEKDSDEPLATVCVVCHDPHGSPYEGQLRKPVNTVSIEEHLCAQCHNRRSEPSGSSSHGLEPHAPEAALLIGDAGWFPPGSDIEQGKIRGTHGSERNERLCATCHLPMFEVTDPETGGHVFSSTGHLFRPIPCVDEQGIPLPFESNCDLTTDSRSYISCVSSGCHADQQAAYSALVASVNTVQNYADDLIEVLRQVDPNLAEPGGEIDPTTTTFTVAEGSLFNYNLATFGNAEFGTNTVVGSSVHNPFLMRSLLLASLDAVEEAYGLKPARMANVDFKQELRKVLNSVPDYHMTSQAQ